MCPTCHGAGQCVWCSGSGTLMKQDEQGRMVRVGCPYCLRPGIEKEGGRSGDGRCVVCRGTGRKP